VGEKFLSHRLGEKMKIKKLVHTLTHIAQLYPEADVKFEGTEHIFSTDKENGEVEWSHRNIKSIELVSDIDNREKVVVKL
tara:strand:- start:1264 stop:1503 length:240 start_codon:yes stop_codon:yes gene_type:complete